MVMDLKKYDNKMVRITDIFDDVFEGYSIYNSSEYNYHEYGKDMDSLQIVDVMFYKDIIKNIEIIDNYSTSHSKLEEVIVEDIDSIEEVLLGEDSNYIYRLLLYLKEYINKIKFDKSYEEKLLKYLDDYLKICDSNETKIIINDIINNVNDGVFMNNIEKGSIKHLIISIITISITGIILYPIFDLVLCALITKAKFVYSVHNYIIQPIIFGVIMGTVFWISDKK